jgi:hypothetical protein
MKVSGMTNFKKLQSMPLDELAKWLSKHLAFNDAPHMIWFDRNYCDKCEPEKIELEGNFDTYEYKFAYCDFERKCRFFPEMDKVPDNLTTIKMWLEAEVEE